MKRLCNRCPRRPGCTKLCPKALDYATQDTHTEDPYIVSYVKSDSALDYLSLRSLLGIRDYTSDITYSDWVTIRDSRDLHKLSHRQRQCFYLYHWERLTTYQIAGRLFIDHSTVVRHIQSASYLIENALKIRIAKKPHQSTFKLL